VHPSSGAGSIIVSVSHDTPAFAAHAISRWWQQEGSLRYPRSRHVLIRSDTGGSNGCRCRAWETELPSQLANSFGLTLTVAHYPTGASKWNPIEHRLFSEISKNWAGEPLDNCQKILRFIRSRGLLTSTVCRKPPEWISICHQHPFLWRSRSWSFHRLKRRFGQWCGTYRPASIAPP
jgi:Rhodopirellula transposase DDE domain